MSAVDLLELFSKVSTELQKGYRDERTEAAILAVDSLYFYLREKLTNEEKKK
jgi:hypothetical protein